MTLLRRRLLRIGAFGSLALSGSALWVMLEHARETAPAEPEPNPLLGGPVPRFALPGLTDGAGVSSTDFVQAGRPVVLNFFASWCQPCRQEWPLLLALRDQGATIWGIAFRDHPADTQAFLQAAGNPFARIGRDDDGSLAGPFHLLGIPETFLIAPDGSVRWSWAGELHRREVTDTLRPLLR